MSSCTSLDLSAEDFALEPGYAECADAIKTGAIKKISVSHERLVEQSVGSKHEDHKGENCSEIYANPQILFRKRSKMIEDGNEESVSSEDKKLDESIEKTLPGEEEICLAVGSSSKKKEKKSKKSKVVKEVPPEAPPLPARNYSLYLESEEAEQVVQEVLQDCEKGVDIDASSLDDAFDTEESSTVQTAGGETDNEKKHSESGVNENVDSVVKEQKENVIESGDGSDKDEKEVIYEPSKETQTTDNSDKEHAQPVKDSIKENLTESENLTQNTNVQIENCKLCLSSNSCEGKCENGNSTNNDGRMGKDNCLHVVVKDECGVEKVLKVVEKQESFHLQRRRESSKRNINKCAICDDKNEIEGKDVCSNSPCSSEYIHEEVDINTKDEVNISPNFTTANSTNLLKTKDSVDLLNEEDSKNDKKGVNEGCERISETNELGATLKKTHTDFSIGADVENGKLKSYHYDTDSSNKPDSSEVENNSFLTVAVKMKCISVDSDSDFLNTEDLPKLEISESDLESPFDSSDNSNHLDIETESAGINKLTQRLKTEDVINQCSESARLKEDAKGVDEVTEICCSDDKTCDDCEKVTDDKAVKVHVESSEKSGCFMNVGEETKQLFSDSLNFQTDMSVNEKRRDTGFTGTYQDMDEDVVDGFECQASDKKATLNSRLCVVESENELESDLSKLIGNFNAEVVVDKNEELSDDSAIGNIDDFHQNETLNRKDITNSELNTGASQDTNNSNKLSHRNIENSTSKELHLIYEKEHPNLYEDSEPTHMSLHEALGLTPNNAVTRSHSDSSGHSLLFTTSPNTFIHSNIPNIELENQPELDVTPPPRPPPLSSSSQLESRICVTDQSGQEAKAVTPIDEVPTPFSLSYMKTDQSDDEAPPAIPPRHKTVRTPGRPGK